MANESLINSVIIMVIGFVFCLLSWTRIERKSPKPWPYSSWMNIQLNTWRRGVKCELYHEWLITSINFHFSVDSVYDQPITNWYIKQTSEYSIRNNFSRSRICQNIFEYLYINQIFLSWNIVSEENGISAGSIIRPNNWMKIILGRRAKIWVIKLGYKSETNQLLRSNTFWEIRVRQQLFRALYVVPKHLVYKKSSILWTVCFYDQSNQILDGNSYEKTGLICETKKLKV